MEKKKKPPIPTDSKLRGEWAELQFMARAAGMGFRIAKPLGDSYRWDVVVEHEFGFRRVQIKCTSQRVDNGYLCGTYTSKGHLYTASEIDFLAVYVIPEDIWYIIPISTLAGAYHAFLNPHPRRGVGKFEKYREAWDLLRQPGRFDIQACADPGGHGDLGNLGDGVEVVPGSSSALPLSEDSGFSR